jgi:NADPH:quinone reductase-like Zn-dependent oxidoreductase
LKQSVLIHNATGNVGLAALQLAKVSNADVYATVATEAEAIYLVMNFGLPRAHIFWSTDDSFLKGVMQATGGKGVDIALNSLPGDLLHATWKSVAEFGKMIELGTADLVGAGKLELNSFLGGRSYTGVNLEALVAKKQSVVKR